MSRRTAEASKAIRNAWEMEQQRVSEGMGTRDWSMEQQKNILEYGKAYDEDGRAFEGQHMRSAEQYPECQGDPKNIQFLTREEHLAAHDGNWQNPTNWYYDPTNKTKNDFGEGPIIPCMVIKLSNPIACLNNIKMKEEQSEEKGVESAIDELKISDQAPKTRETDNSNERTGKVMTGKVMLENKTGIGSKILSAADSVKKLAHNHPVLTNIVKWTGMVVAGLIVYKSGKSKGSNGADVISVSDDSHNSFFDIDDCDSDGVMNYPDERSSPCEHDVSGYDRQQNGKTVHVNPYKRGRKKNE